MLKRIATALVLIPIVMFIVRGAVSSPGHALLDIVRKFVLSADIFQADVVLVKRGDLGLEVAAQQAHQKINFTSWSLLPVLFGKRVKRKSGNADAGSGLDRVAHGLNAGAMSGDPRHVAPLGPAPVAVHDDGDVSWEPRWIELPVNLGFLAIQTGGNSCLQGFPLPNHEATIAGKGLAMRGRFLGSNQESLAQPAIPRHGRWQMQVRRASIRWLIDSREGPNHHRLHEDNAKLRAGIYNSPASDLRAWPRANDRRPGCAGIV